MPEPDRTPAVRAGLADLLLITAAIRVSLNFLAAGPTSWAPVQALMDNCVAAAVAHPPPPKKSFLASSSLLRHCLSGKNGTLLSVFLLGVADADLLARGVHRCVHQACPVFCHYSLCSCAV